MFMGFQMIILVVILLTILILLYFVPIGLWIQGIVSLGIGRISIVDLIRMRLRKISPRLVTDGVINLHKAGLNQVTTDMLETHYLAGGNVVNVVGAAFVAVAVHSAVVAIVVVSYHYSGPCFCSCYRSCSCSC